MKNNITILVIVNIGGVVQSNVLVHIDAPLVEPQDEKRRVRQEGKREKREKKREERGAKAKKRPDVS